MNNPEEPADIEKDYLDVSEEFETDIDNLDKDFDDDSEEGIFTSEKPQKKKFSLKLTLSAVALALLCGGGFYLYTSSHADFISAPKMNAPLLPKTQNAEKTAIPGMPEPASDFAQTPLAPPEQNPAEATPNMSADNPPLTLDQSASNTASLPKLPGTTENADAVSEVGVNNGAAAPHISDKHSPSEPEPVISTSAPEATTPPLPSPAPIPTQATVAGSSSSSGLTPMPGNVTKAQNAMAPDSSALMPAVSSKTMAETPARNTPSSQVSIKETKTKAKNAIADNFYFDAPKGKALLDIPPPSINPMVEPGQSIIIVHQPSQKSLQPDETVVVEKSQDSSLIDRHLVKATRAANLGMNDEALGFYNDLYKKNSHDPRILMGRAVALQKAGESQKAIEAYREVLEIEPDNAEATTNLMGLIGKTQPAVALQNLIDLHGKYPKNAAVAAQLGVAYAQSGNQEDGLKLLNMAAVQDPKNPLHFYNIAVIYDHQNDRAEAIEFYEKSLDTYSIYSSDIDSSFSKDQVYDRLAALRGN